MLARQSDFFKNLFALPHGAEEDREGTDARPLTRPQVSARGLGHLFEMVYTVSGHDLPLSDDEFEEVLVAAHRFQFRDVLGIVPRRMDARFAAERKLALGLQCGVQYWQLRAFAELVLSFAPRDAAATRLGDAVWMKVFAARAQLGQARVDAIAAALAPSACGHIAAALVSSVPFAAPGEFRTKYWEYRTKARPRPGPGPYRTAPVPREHQCCRLFTDFDVTGGPNDRMHTVLLPADTEHAIIEAVWNAP